MHVQVCISSDNTTYMILVLHSLPLSPWEKTVINLMARLSAFIKMAKTSCFLWMHEHRIFVVTFSKGILLRKNRLFYNSCCTSKPQLENINCVVTHLLVQLWPLDVHTGEQSHYKFSLMYLEIYKKQLLFFFNSFNSFTSLVFSFYFFC